MIAVAHRVPRDASALTQWVDAGASRFEADVQLAGDARIVVSHYLPFLRIRGWLQHDGTTFRWRNGGRGSDPTLADTLELLPPGVGVLLDPKETRPERRAALAAALAGTLPDPARFVVSTDDADDLARYRDAGFGTWRTVKDPAALQTVVGGEPLSDGGVSIRHSLLDAGIVSRLHEIVPLVVAWTVNDAVRAQELVAAGVDGVTTDSPAIARLVTRPGTPPG